MIKLQERTSRTNSTSTFLIIMDNTLKLWMALLASKKIFSHIFAYLITKKGHFLVILGYSQHGM